MKSSKRHIAGTNQPRVRSEVALSALQQTGGGKHGKTRRDRSKADRRAARQELRP